MDYPTVMDMIDRTLVDKIECTVTFEDAVHSVRVRLSIENTFFRIEFRSSTGDWIVATPGRVSAGDGANSFEAMNVDTSPALTAWKSQPPTNYSPLGSGLTLLATSMPQIDLIVGRLAGFQGSLGVGIIPSLCWYSSQYPSLTFGNLKLQNVTGRICLEDIVLASDHVSFSVRLAGAASQCRFVTALHIDQQGNILGEDSVVVDDASLTIKCSADLDLTNELADVVIDRANIESSRLLARMGEPADQWSISTRTGFSIEVENSWQKLHLNPPRQLSTRGTLRFKLPECKVSKQVLNSGPGTAIVFLAPISVIGLSLDLSLNSTTGLASQTTGVAQLSSLSLIANYSDANMVFQGVNGTLQVETLTFGPETINARFSLLGTQVAQIRIPTGPTPVERFTVSRNLIDLAGHFSALPNQTTLLMQKLHVTGWRGAWNLVLQAVNSADPNDPLALQIDAGRVNAIDLFAQQYLSVSGAVNRTTAESLEVRVQNVSTAAPVERFILSEHHELTEESFLALRAIPVPESVLASFEQDMLNVRYDTREDLLTELRRRLSTPDLVAHGAAIDNAANHHQNYLANAQLEVADVLFQGSLLEKTRGNAELHGELSWSIIELGFDEVVGLELPNFKSLGRVHPIDANDRYPVTDGKFFLPQGTFRPGIAALSQQFDSATIDIGGSATIVVNPGANRLRVNLMPQLPVVDSVAAQVSIPSSTLNVGSTNLGLTNAKVDVLRRTFTPEINTSQRSVLFDSVLRFGIVSGPIVFPLFAGKTIRLSKDDLSLSSLIQFFTALLNDAGIAIPNGTFDVLERAMNNPAVDIAGDLLEQLNDLISDLTGFGIDDFGFLIQTHDVTARLLGFPESNSSRVSVALRVRLPAIGAYVSYRWREPRFDIPPYKDESDTKELPPVDLLPFNIDLVLSVSYRMNSVTHAIEITDVSVRVLPNTGTVADAIISESMRLFEAMVGITVIRETVVKELGSLFHLALPDNLNIDLARIEFDAAAKMTISVEARQMDWNAI